MNSYWCLFHIALKNKIFIFLGFLLPDDFRRGLRSTKRSKKMERLQKKWQKVVFTEYYYCYHWRWNFSRALQMVAFHPDDILHFLLKSLALLLEGVFSILQPHLCLWDILLWDILIWYILLQLYTSTNSLHKALTKSFWNTLSKKDVNKYF